MATTVNTKNLDNLWKKFKNITEEEKRAKLSEWGKKGNAASKDTRLRNMRTKKWIDASIEMAVQNIAKQVQIDIKKQFMDELDRFYADYTPNPNGYDRTYSLKHAYVPTFTKQGKTYTFGAVLDPSEIVEGSYQSIYSPYNPTSSVYVFERFYNEGWHGADMKHNGWIAPQMNPYAPREYMHWWWDGYKKHIQKKFDAEFIEALNKNKNILKG